MLLLLFVAIQDVDRAVRDLSSDDVEVRTRAAESLTKAGLVAAAPVAALLEATDEDLAGRAESILRSIGLPARAAVRARTGERARRLERALVLDKAKVLVLEGDRFTVDWGEPPEADARTILEAAFGEREAGPTTWLRFVPGKEAVDVLRLELDGGALKVSRAVLATAAYHDVISVVAAIAEGQLHDESRRERHLGGKSVWRFASMERDGVRGADLEYGGLTGTTFAGKLARPRGAVAMALEAIKPLVFRESALEARDRAAVSARFNRAWKWIESAQFFGWIRERSLQLVGLAGDASALPLLRAIVSCADAKSPELSASVAAAARLLAVSVPADIEEARRRILDSIPK